MNTVISFFMSVLFAVMNDPGRVVTYMTEYGKLTDGGHKWPLYNADSARTSMAAYIMLERAGAF